MFKSFKSETFYTNYRKSNARPRIKTPTGAVLDELKWVTWKTWGPKGRISSWDTGSVQNSYLIYSLLFENAKRFEEESKFANKVLLWPLRPRYLVSLWENFRNADQQSELQVNGRIQDFGWQVHQVSYLGRGYQFLAFQVTQRADICLQIEASKLSKRT